jgi:hypothetical protein
MASRASFEGNNYGFQLGSNNGSITIENHLPLGKFSKSRLPSALLTALSKEQPETPPQPLSTIPFHRDPDFIDRRTLVNHIHEKGSALGIKNCTGWPWWHWVGQEYVVYLSTADISLGNRN